MANAVEFSIKALDNFSAVMDKQFNQMTRLEGAFAALGITAAVYGALNLAKQSLDNAEAMGTAAVKANMTVEAFSALAFAASQSNVEIGTLETGLRGLNKAMTEDKTTGGGLQLELLGISARDANGNLRQTINVLADVADSFEAGADDATKTKVAMELFGKAGLGMIPMLNQGSDAIDEMMGKAAEFGQVISGDFASSADQINDNLAQLSSIVSGTVNVAMTSLAPLLQVITTEFAAMAAEGGKVQKAGESIATIMRVIMSGGAILIGVFDALGTVIGATAAAMILFASGEFTAAVKTYTAGITDMAVTAGETAIKVKGYWDGTADAAAAAAIKTGEAIRKTTGEMKADSAEKAKARKSAEDLKKSIDDTENSLNAQLSTIGLTSAQTKVYELNLKGATVAQLAQVQALADTVDRQKRWADDLATSKSIIEGARTEQEQHNERISEMSRLKEAGAMTNEQYTESLKRENEQWNLNKISTEEYKNAAVDSFEVMGDMMAAHLSQLGSTSFLVGEMMFNASMSMTKGIGDAVASSIIDGTRLEEALGNVLKNVAKQVISTLIQIGIQKFILAKIFSATAATEGAAQIGSGLAQVSVNSFASAAAIPFYGWAIAPQVAIANTALAAGMATTSMATGAGIGMAAGIAHGGLNEVPSEATYLLDKGERVLSPRQNTDLTSFLDGEDGGRGRGTVVQNLTIHVLENATNVDAFARMDKIELRNTLGQPVVDALNEMFSLGVRPDFAMQGR